MASTEKMINCYACQRLYYLSDAFTKGRFKSYLSDKVNQFKTMRPWYCHDCIEHQEAPSFVIQQHQHRLD